MMHTEQRDEGEVVDMKRCIRRGIVGHTSHDWSIDVFVRPHVLKSRVFVFDVHNDIANVRAHPSHLYLKLRKLFVFSENVLPSCVKRRLMSL